MAGVGREGGRDGGGGKSRLFIVGHAAHGGWGPGGMESILSEWRWPNRGLMLKQDAETDVSMRLPVFKVGAESCRCHSCGLCAIVVV